MGRKLAACYGASTSCKKEIKGGFDTLNKAYWNNKNARKLDKSNPAFYFFINYFGRTVILSLQLTLE